MRNLILFLSLSVIFACNGQDDPFERIQKLRALGVGSNPLALTPQAESEQKFTLTVYAAVPLGQSITLEPSLDEGSKFAQVVTVSVIAGSESYKDYGQLRLFQGQFSLVVPPIPVESIPKDTGFLPLRYALVLRSGDEEEKIVGNVLLYPPDSPKLLWKTPTAEITSPQSGEGLVNSKKIELKANLINPNEGDNLRVSWFVSSGNVINRRARETVWEKADGGTQSIILTVRGLKSGAMAPPLVLDVNI
jgi:hypothetical protein